MAMAKVIPRRAPPNQERMNIAPGGVAAIPELCIRRCSFRSLQGIMPRPWTTFSICAGLRSLKPFTSGEDASVAWRTATHACRWGVVIVCLTLAPGVALVGQGIGRWLRAQSTSPWRLPFAAPLPVAETPGSDVATASPLLVARRSMGPPPPEQSAAMYSGSPSALPPEEASAAPPAVVPVLHATPLSSKAAEFARFTELEQALRDYGALSYALESDRRSRYAYRFHCVMPPQAPGGAEYTVEASGATALEAIQRVVRQLGAATPGR